MTAGSARPRATASSAESSGAPSSGPASRAGHNAATISATAQEAVFNLESGDQLPGRQPRQIGIHHHGDQTLEVDLGVPAKLLPGFGRVADQVIHFGGLQEFLVDADMFLPVEPGV